MFGSHTTEPQKIAQAAAGLSRSSAAISSASAGRDSRAVYDVASRARAGRSDALAILRERPTVDAGALSLTTSTVAFYGTLTPNGARALGWSRGCVLKSSISYPTASGEFARLWRGSPTAGSISVCCRRDGGGSAPSCHPSLGPRDRAHDAAAAFAANTGCARRPLDVTAISGWTAVQAAPAAAPLDTLRKVLPRPRRRMEEYRPSAVVRSPNRGVGGSGSDAPTGRSRSDPSPPLPSSHTRAWAEAVAAARILAMMAHGRRSLRPLMHFTPDRPTSAPVLTPALLDLNHPRSLGRIVARWRGMDAGCWQAPWRRLPSPCPEPGSHDPLDVTRGRSRCRRTGARRRADDRVSVLRRTSLGYALSPPRGAGAIDGVSRR